RRRRRGSAAPREPRPRSRNRAPRREQLEPENIGGGVNTMSVRLDHGELDLAEVHEINVTPFIDVILVLLIIFMIAAPLATVDIAAEIDRPELCRWSACAAAVLIVHALVALALSLRPEEAEPDAGAPVVLLELAPIPAAPAAPEADLAPGPQQLQPESQDRPR